MVSVTGNTAARPFKNVFQRRRMPAPNTVDRAPSPILAEAVKTGPGVPYAKWGVGRWHREPECFGGTDREQPRHPASGVALYGLLSGLPASDLFLARPHYPRESSRYQSHDPTMEPRYEAQI